MRIIIPALFVCACSFVFAACENKSKNVKSRLFNVAASHTRQIAYQSIALDSLALEDVESSLVGNLNIHRDSIYFTDYRFGWVYSFDKEGRFSKRYLGQGDRPNQIPTKEIDFNDIDTSGKQFFIGLSWDCHLYNKDLIKIAAYPIGWRDRLTTKSDESATQVNPSDQSLYTLVYSLGKIRYMGETVYLPIAAQHPVFNPLSDKYVDEARVLALLDVKTGKIRKIIGRISPYYSEHREAKLFSFSHFDVTNKNQLLITYAADSMIYVADDNFTITKAFGMGGVNMNKEYKKIDSLKDFHKAWTDQSERCGYYTSLEYIDEKDLLFRTYSKGAHALKDGLQVYRDSVLVADVEVPKKFKMAGYIAPYYYSQPYVTDNGQLKLYRFKLD